MVSFSEGLLRTEKLSWYDESDSSESSDVESVSESLDSLEESELFDDFEVAIESSFASSLSSSSVFPLSKATDSSDLIEVLEPFIFSFEVLSSTISFDDFSDSLLCWSVLCFLSSSSVELFSESELDSCDEEDSSELESSDEDSIEVFETPWT